MSVQGAIDFCVARGRPCYIGNNTITADGTVPDGAVVEFLGTLSSAQGIRLVANGKNIELRRVRLAGPSLRFSVNADGVVVNGLTSVGASRGMHFQTNHLLNQSRAKNITVRDFHISGATNGVLIDGCENVYLVNGEIAADCADGWANYGSRDLTVERVELKGRWKAGFRNLAHRVASGPLGFQRTVYRNCKVSDFFDPDNGQGEGISFDCHGNDAEATAVVLTTTVESVGSGYIVPVADVASGHQHYAARFQTGELAGQAYVVSSTGSTDRWVLGDGFAAAQGQVQAGDVVTLELDCRDNLIEECDITCVEDEGIEREQRNAVHIWGMSGVRIANPTLRGTVAPDIRVSSIRGIIGASQDYAVAHHVSVDRARVDGDIHFEATSFGGYELPYSYENSVRRTSARQLRLVRQNRFSKVEDSAFALADDVS